MFGGRFGQIRFGLHTQSEMNIPINVRFSDVLKNLSGFGVTIVVEEMLFDSLSSKAKITPTTPIDFKAIDGLQVVANMIGGIVISFEVIADLQNDTDIVKNIGITEEIKDSFLNITHIVKDMYIGEGRENFVEKLELFVFLAKNIETKRVFSDILNCYVSTVILENDIAKIEVTLPPGSMLQINSETYDVLLDGKNILHLQSGDWIFIDRDSISLSIDTGTGGELEGNLLYKERYL